MSSFNHPFTEGQRVRCVADDFPAKVGDVVTVTRTASGSGLFHAYFQGGIQLFLNSHFEPSVEAPVTADVDFPRYQQDRQVEEAPSSDPVFRPNHYARYVIEPITFIQANNLPFDIGNVIKYACRYDAKNGLEDLQKARRYLDIRIETLARQDRINDGEDARTVWADVL